MKETGISEKQAKQNSICFPLGTLGRDMIYSLFTNYILLYVLFTHSLTDAQLMAVTAVMVAARVFDALNDPIMGNIIERTRTRWGKYKPWMVIGILTTSVVVYLAFNVRLEGWAFVAFFAVIYFAYSITYTMHDISYWGMISALGSDSATRDMLTARTNLVAGVGGAVAGLLIPLLTTGENALGGSAQTAYGLVALVFVIIAPLFLAFTVFGVRENRSYMDTPAPPVSFKKILSTIGGNRQLLWISLIFLLQQMGADLITGGIGSTYIYFTFGYEGGLYSLFSTVGLSASAVLLLVYPMISKKWHRKQLMTAFGAIAWAGYAVMLLAGLMMPVTMVKFWVLTIAFMFTQLGQNCFYMIMMISILNTVEYNEYTRGSRDEAIITSLRPFLTKLASAIVVALTSGAYLLFRVTDYTNRISDLEQAASIGTVTEAEKLTKIAQIIGEVTPGQSTGLLCVLCLLPCALMLVSYFLYRRFYTLDEETYAAIVAKLNDRAGGEQADAE